MRLSSEKSGISARSVLRLLSEGDEVPVSDTRHAPPVSCRELRRH